MNRVRMLAVTLVALVPLALATACAKAPDSARQTSTAMAASRASSPAVPTVSVAVPTNVHRLVVHKSPMCGCCSAWVDHMRTEGFVVEVRDLDNLHPVKERLGVPLGKGSCHTAEIAGYFIEGHVPAADVKRLLTEKPDAKGLVLPGMPLGSPGMEMPDGTREAYTVELVDRQGATRPFAHH